MVKMLPETLVKDRRISLAAVNRLILGLRFANISRVRGYLRRT